MHATNVLAVLLSVSLATGFYIPPRPLLPRRADIHPEIQNRQVVRSVDTVAPFLSADGSTIPGPVYGFPGDLVDPSTSTTASPTPTATPEGAPVETPTQETPTSAATEVIVPSAESQPTSVEQAPAPVETVVATPEAPATTPAASLPDVGTDDNGNEVHIEYAYSTSWSTEVVYVTASP